MDEYTTQPDLEYGTSPSPPHIHSRSYTDASGPGGSTIQEVPIASPQSNNEEKFFPYDRFAGVQSPINEQGMNIPVRSNTGLTQTLYSDPSAKIWNMYLSQAEKFDKDHSESWTANTDGVLVFTGLFSAVVAGFIIVSYPQLQSNPSDITNQLLAQISQQLAAAPNGAAPAPLTLSDLSSFQPTASSVRVNAFWFTSLATSTACALWATLMQQWTRRFVQVADRPYNPSKRARIRAFFADGVERFGLAAAVEVLPALLHTSVLLFYIGLIDFLFGINHTVAYILLVLVAVGVLIYFVLTIMPLCFHNSPYQTPISALVWFAIEAAPLLKLWLRRKTGDAQKSIRERRHKIRQGMRQALEKKADSRASQSDARALRWTLTFLDEDHEFEDFLDGLPGLFTGSMGHLARGIKPELERLVEPVADRLFATCSTGLLPEVLRRQRLTACLGAIWCFPNTIGRHFHAIRDQWTRPMNDPWGPLSTETWAVATRLTDDPSTKVLDPVIAIHAHCVQALMATMWEDDKWQCPSSEANSLLQRQLGAPSVDISRWRENKGHLQLAVAANLLFHALPLLHELKPEAGVSLKNDITDILDLICGELVEIDVPDDLRTRFPNVFNAQELPQSFRRRAGFDTHKPWTRIFAPV